MMYLAPNIYVIQYLQSTHQLSLDMRRKAITNINIGKLLNGCIPISVWSSDEYAKKQFVPHMHISFSPNRSRMLKNESKNSMLNQKLVYFCRFQVVTNINICFDDEK